MVAFDHRLGTIPIATTKIATDDNQALFLALHNPPFANFNSSKAL
jgi:hypothetical protein